MRRLLAAAAFAPLSFAAHGALAQTSITTATTAPLATSTSGNIDITSAGSVTLLQGVAITINSDNTVNAAGAISVKDSTAGVGILVLTPAEGRNSTITLSSTISADDTQVNIDGDKDGDPDGAFVQSGVVRYGLRVTGPGPFIGDITQSAGQINVEGNANSAGISIETALTGNLSVLGGIGVLGSDSFGVHVVGPVTGNVRIGGTLLVSARGERAVGVALDSPISGALVVDGSVTASGYRFTGRDDQKSVRDKLDADDLLIGGPGMRIRGSIGGGLLVDAAPGDTDGTNGDEDADGVPDSQETTGVISSFGSAPGLLIAGPDNITIGNVADRAFGIVVKGVIAGNGLFDGVSATGVKIGGGGGVVDTTGGIALTGEINAVAYRANPTALWLASGAIAPLVVIDTGQISAGAEGADGFNPTARAFVVDSGARVDTLINNGAIRAGVGGFAGNATAVLDNGGMIATITNTGTITATLTTGVVEKTAVGNAIALDLRANTTGVTLSQSPNGNPDFNPTIVGDILFSASSLNDSVSITGGSTSGAIAFGGGDDVLTVGGGASSRANLRKTEGGFVVGVDGNLALTNTNRVNLTSLAVGSSGQLTFTADPRNADASQRATFFNVAGDATLGAGSKVALEFKSKLVNATTYTLIHAGTLTNQGLDTSLISALPLIFTGQVSVTGNDLKVFVRRREAAELGLTGGRAAAFEAFYQSFDADPGVAAAVFSKTTKADFNKLYDQFLPDYSGGPFNSLANSTRAVLQAQGEQPKDLVAGEPRSWLQEVGVGVKHESVNDIEYQSGGFGIAGGFEKPIGDDGAYGFSGAFLSSEIRNAQRTLGSVMTASAFLSSVYVRAQERGMVIDASLSGGYAWFGSDRRIVDSDALGTQNLVRQPSADWSGALAAARMGVAYNWEAGPFYVRHDAVLDSVYLREGAYSEMGGGASANLYVGQRTNYETAAEAGLLLGARFGTSFRWGPEIRVAYRGLLDGGEGDTVGHFISVPGASFALPGLAKDRQRIIVRAALRGSGAYANFALEASGDIGEVYQAYMARVLVRFLF